ncbi:MAG: hypothetical protein K0U98_27355 [Deltaproteobacteria bacterium]|nr:hypothetical protein [Deltaproteobacteria bacterium]
MSDRPSAETPDSSASLRVSRPPTGFLAGGLALAVLVVAVAYGRGLSVGFLADDFNILEDLLTLGPLSRWASQGQPFLRPFTVWSYFVELQLWGLTAWAFHLVNLLIHLLVGVGVAVVAAQLVARFTNWGQRERWQVGGAAGLLYLCHPSHVEAVVWISCRGDLQAALFALTCLACHGQWVATGGLQGGRRRWRWAALAALVLALGSKEAAVTLPFAVLTLEWVARGRGGESRTFTQRLLESLKAAGPFLAALPAYIGLRAWVLGTWVGGYGTKAHFKTDPIELLDTLFVDFSRSLIPMIAGKQLPEGVVAVILASAVIWMLWRRIGVPGEFGGRPAVALPGLCLLLFSVTAVPTLSIRISENSTSSERLLYLPSAFSLILLAVLLQLAVASSGRRWLVVAAICLPLTLQTAFAMEPWRQAGRAAATVVETIVKDEGPANTYLLGVPDSIRGAYVFRIGIGSALRLEGAKSDKTFLVHRVMLPRGDCQLETRWQGREGTIFFKDRQCRGRFRYFGKGRKMVKEIKSGAFKSRFRLPRMTRRDRIWLYSGGEMKLIQEGEPGPAPKPPTHPRPGAEAW